ncbi:methyl-accepting chemotaxis protein [Paraburkholderia lycopersici]|uniref:Methyl-accepting chemotaxis protein-1, serine sensor receptor n=1 Tax=Paraburkholderia lycopersici TaxID=416944 RepID=A0A1G6YS88_9BURK|nr:methyl-accepting chemotaxis protein [Paraburkholderia lycopersici]SDD92893.1 methyl-accepting chemotaxis protein-1, serine sensor receptor [Paraburkholderia lycopersici]
MRKLTIKARLVLLSTAVVFVSLCIGAVGLFGVSTSITTLQTMFEGRVQALQAISTIDELVTEASFSVSDAILDPSAQKTQLVVEGTSSRIARIDALMQGWLSRTDSTDGRSRAQAFSANWATLRDKGLRPAVQLLGQNNLSEAQWIQTQTIDPVSKTVKTQGAQLRTLELADAQSEYAQACKTGRVVEWLVVGLIFAGVAGIAALCASIARSLFRDLGAEPFVAAQLANRVASGDLSVEVAVRPGDTHSVLYAMKAMQQRLASIIGGIRDSAEAIAEATAHIASGNGTLAQRTEQHAATIQQTSTSMEQLATMVRSNAGHATQARTLAGIASAKAGDGDRAARDAGERMRALAQRSARIQEITSVIDGISFQTNLLALNAAVEAARAGSQGRGFAVVAQEVRALAERSSGAAKEIDTLIKEMTAEVDQSSHAVEAAATTIVDLLGAVRGVAGLVDSIADASQEQRAGIDEVNTSVAVMDRVTQQNAAFVQDGVEAAGALRTQAETLRSAVRAFHL